jgi:adenylylsulfate kinase
MKTVFVIHGLPGSGKTTLADMLLELIGGARINADQIRSTISRDLKFTRLDRAMQAYRLGAITAVSLQEPISVTNDLGHHEEYADSGQVVTAHLNKTAIVDFVNPTQKTRDVFDWALRTNTIFPIRKVDVWMDTIAPEQSRFPDTAKMYERPRSAEFQITGWKTEQQLRDIARQLAERRA